MADGAENRITVIAAAINESSQLREWLDALSWGPGQPASDRWVSRMVVVDTGSRDGTPERLREAGVEVIEWRPPGELIHAAKNKAIAQVRQGWILDLDLDERVPAALQAEIMTVVEAGTHEAYRVPFRHYVFGRWLKHGGWSSKHLRLYRAGALRYPEDRAHSSPEVRGSTGELDEFVCHFAHPTIHDFLTKTNRYTTQDAPLIRRHGHGGLRNRSPLSGPDMKPRPLAWARASLSVFWNRYVKAAGFKDGLPGFVAAVLMATYGFIEQTKVWEYDRNRQVGETP